MSYKITVLTLFPDLFPGPLGHSITGRALKNDKWQLETIDIRSFALDKHNTVDDAPYGGGAGMLMRPDVVAAAIEKAKETNPNAKVVYLSPCGKPFKQNVAREFAAEEGLILLCGHYEGIDQRVLDSHVDMEVSLGDFVLTGGEVAVYPMVDSLLRLIPDVLGNSATLHEESFEIGEDAANLLEYPHYTRPEVWNDMTVPEVLRSGHHGKIAKWRREQAEMRTKARRPDLLKKD